MTSLLESQGNIEEQSAVEGFKAASDGLYGSIPADLASDRPDFQEESIQLLKHHGTYQQDNRDTRRDRKKAGLGPDYSMMLRTKFPGGRFSAEQYLLCDDLATRYGNPVLRTTSRQDLQFYGVVKNNLRSLIHDLNTLAKISTLGGCGDVVRNTMASPVADIDPRYKDLSADLLGLAQQISDRFMPATSSYFDLWLNDEKAQVKEDGTVSFAGELKNTTEESLYGKQYLPRKFKIGIGADFDNSVDLYTQDLGIMAITADGVIQGYEILVGGGLGHSHAKKNTYPRIASHLAFVAEEEVIPIAEAVIKVQRDYGDRKDRKQARLKYTIDRMGLDLFRQQVEQYAGRRFGAPRNIKPSAQPDYLGWHKQIQPGLNYLGIWIENGRINDFENSYQFKTGLRAIIEEFKPNLRITPHHNIILANLKEEDVPRVKELLARYHLPTDEGISPLRRMEMACPALPMCPLAQSEAERVIPSFMKGLETAGHGDADVCIRMTGCPNGCARSTSSEIGLIGKGPGRYILRTGGDFNGTRLNEVLLPMLKEDQVVNALACLLDAWKQQTEQQERFGDWSHRVGTDTLKTMLAEAGIA